MNETSLFLTSVVVFSLMFIGLVLTIYEFRYGAPKKQAEAAKAEQKILSESKKRPKSRQRDVV